LLFGLDLLENLGLPCAAPGTPDAAEVVRVWRFEIVMVQLAEHVSEAGHVTTSS
jgi:hypothetical protein